MGKGINSLRGVERNLEWWILFSGNYPFAFLLTGSLLNHVLRNDRSAQIVGIGVVYFFVLLPVETDAKVASETTHSLLTSQEYD